ncbi:MAG: hypothetical protein NVSMB9_36900 [Isosphaeraceae bacterium]
MAKAKTMFPAPPGGGPMGTFVYFILKAGGTVVASYGAGTATLDSLLSVGWTALREVPLAGGEVFLVLRR